MKKIILVAAMVLGFAVAASAQPKALGLRFGYGAELSYQHNMGGANFLEADLGLGEFKFFNAAVAYNFMIAQPSWTSRGTWGFYAGPGAGLGLGIGNDGNGNKHNYFTLSAAGMVGLEYTFWFPLQLSVDFRQHIGFGFGKGMWFPSSVGISARYRF